MAGSINSLIFIWSEYAQLYENDQKETKKNIVEATHTGPTKSSF